MNKLILQGFVGANPEVKQVGESKVASFSLATTERYKNKSGEKVEDTTWHRVEAWGKQAEIIGQHVKKGSQLLVIGQQRHEKHEDKFFAKVRLQEFEFVGSAKAEAGNNSEPVADGGDELPF